MKCPALLVACVLAFALCGCSGKGEGVSGSKKVVITYWAQPLVKSIEGMENQTPNPGDYETILAQRFMEMHPEVEIRVQSVSWDDMTTKVPAAVLAGRAPDVVSDYLGRTSGYAYKGWLEPLENAIPPDELADYYEDWIRQYTVDGHLHGLPGYAWLNVLVVNRALWDAAGKADLIPTLDDPTWTVDDFREACKAVAKPGEVWPFGLLLSSEQGDYNRFAFLWGFGAKLYENGDYSRPTLASAAGVKGLEFLLELQKGGLVQPGATTIKDDPLNNLFWMGKVGIQGHSLVFWKLTDLVREEGRVKVPMDLTLAKYPNVPGVKAGLAMGPSGHVVFRQSDPVKRKWAIEFVRYMSLPEHVKAFCRNCGQLPSRKSVGNPRSQDPFYTASLRLMEEYGVEDMGLTSPYYYDIRVELTDQMQAAFLGKKTAREALADYEKNAREIIARARR
ncbi:MAG: extracellular solute-binding protein [Planctomycetota bacterium]